MAVGKCSHDGDQGVYTFLFQGIVHGSAEATYGSVSFDTYYTGFVAERHESLLMSFILEEEVRRQRANDGVNNCFGMRKEATIISV